MKRWAVWFLLGFGLYFVFTVDATLHPKTVTPLQRAMSLAFLYWLWVTAFAVPIGIIVWLVRGRRADTA